MVVMMVMVMMVLLPESERRTCERHQDQSCCKKSLHGSNPSMIFIDRNARSSLKYHPTYLPSISQVSKRQRSGTSLRPHHLIRRRKRTLDTR